MTSNATCASPATVTSSTITMNVNPVVTPTVTVSAIDTTICAGDNAVFTAIVVHGGSSPTYQWRVNGANTGPNNFVFNTTSLADNDVVTCVVTSNKMCASPDSAVGANITMSVTPTVTPSNSISVSPNDTICDGDNVTFTATPTNGGTSPSYQWRVNNGPVGTNSSTYSTSSLSDGDFVTCELTSNATCASPANAMSNTINMTVNPNLTPSVVITASDTVICDSASVTFTAVATNGGPGPSYQWKLNGSNVGTNSTGYVNNTLSNGDVVTCVVTSSAPCLATPTGTSNSITMTVNPNLVPSVSIVTSADTICAGGSVTFTATPTNGGTTPSYQWKVNGSNAGTNSNMFTTTTLSNGDVVSCEMTSNATCLATPTGVSNNITMVVNPLLTPSVSIASNKPDTICATDTVTYTATPTNGGATPSYQWKLNGGNVGTNSATYTQTSFSNGDVISCELTSSETCASPTTGTSNSITMTVQGTTPGVSISSSLGSTICAGASVTFTATPSNAGASPSYQWEVNGNAVGINSPTYVTAALNDGDTVNCIVTSSLSCSSPTTALSNKIGMTVNPNLTPIIAISVSPNDTICDGTSVTFTSTYANGGPTPSFQWKVNGSNVGINADSFVTSSLSNNDVVTVVMTSSETCVTKSADTSNGITMTVNPNLVPVATIMVTPNDTICDGANAIFTSSIANGGTTPSYQWQINGSNVGTNNDTFQTTGLVNGDQVRLILTSSETCLAKPGDTSNVIAMTIVPNVTPSVSITVSPNDTVCAGTSVTFTATPTNGGTTPSYQWKLNGSNVGTKQCNV